MSRKLSESDKKVVAFNQEWKCSNCNELLPSSYQIDHIIPYSISYNDDFSNLTALCPTCHANKTQREYKRINNFKKYISEIGNKNVCWFCLSPDSCHNCDKIVKPITTYKTLKDISDFDKFYYTERERELEEEFSNLNINTVLNIYLEEEYIFVNNFFTEVKEYTIEEIAKSVFIATRNKKDSRRYTEVQININIDNIYSEKEIINFLHNNLPKSLPKRIFNPFIETRFIYLIL